jgi:hypothetical protein
LKRVVKGLYFEIAEDIGDRAKWRRQGLGVHWCGRSTEKKANGTKGTGGVVAVIMGYYTS